MKEVDPGFDPLMGVQQEKLDCEAVSTKASAKSEQSSDARMLTVEREGQGRP